MERLLADMDAEGSPWVPAWTPLTFWSEHAPFARWIARTLQPRTFVELGSHWGFSYFAMMQALAEAGVEARGWAIDNWEGDIQNGFYSTEVFDAVSAHNAARYADRSTLLRMTFETARPAFGAGQIDLLHIDGLHTYEAVKADFEGWKDTLSSRGVVLFHDTAVEGRGYDVGRFWREVSQQYPSFEFTHGYGLGVLCVGPDVPAALLKLCAASADPEAVAKIRAHYARLGAQVGRECRDRLDKASLARSAVAAEPVADAEVVAPDVAAEPVKFVERDRFDRSAHPPVGRKAALRGVMRSKTQGRRVQRIRGSILVDRPYMLAQRPDMAHARDPVRAFMFNPSYRYVDPNPLFDALGYLQRNPDVAGGGVHPVMHYLEHGWREGRDAHPLFDSRWYLARNPDVAASGVEPLSHFLRQGWRDGRDPHPLVSLAWLSAQWRARRKRGETSEFQDPLTRYLHGEDGWRAGVSPHPLFDGARYRRLYAEQMGADEDPLSHFLALGAQSNNSPHAMFDTGFYRDGANAPNATPAQLLTRYLVVSDEPGQDVDPSPYFATSWYRRQQTQNKHVPALLDYVQTGAAAGLSPHPLLDARYIASDIAPLDAIVAYIDQPPGVRPGLNPHPLFSRDYYQATNPDVVASGAEPLSHYLKGGWREGRKPHPLFDPVGYMRLHPDIDAAGHEPLTHYVSSGIAEGRQPSDYFDPGWYRHTSGSTGGLVEYLTGGWRTGASPHPLFDTAFYLSSNPDVAAAGIDPLSHYVADGWRQHRAPHPLFDVRWHLDHVDAARAANVEPLGRYLAVGAALGEPTSPYFDAAHYARQRGDGVENPLLAYLNDQSAEFDPHPLFDESWYVSQYAAAMAPLERGLAHYLRAGRHLGFKPNQLFDADYYRQTYPDVDVDGAEPLLHYWKRGGREGRNPHPLFNSRYYLDRYPDVAEAGANPLAHYLKDGIADGRDPHPLFDTSYYLKKEAAAAGHAGGALAYYLGTSRGAADPHPLFSTTFYFAARTVLAKSGVAGLYDYVTEGWRADVSPHPLFNVPFYTAQIPDVAARDVEPLSNYLQQGWRNGRKPHPLFDPAWYSTRYPDVAASGQEPLSHYISSGIADGRQPSIYFDPEWYSRSSGAPGNLVTYVESEWRTGASPHPLFDAERYVSLYPDAADADVSPLEHYVVTGAKAGYNPHALFHVSYYVSQNPDAAARDLEPLSDYLETGWRKGLKPHPLFDPAWYVDQNPDVAAGGQEPLTHYITTGAADGRQPSIYFAPGWYSRTSDAANGLADYVDGGWRDGVSPHPLFDAERYVSLYPEAAAANVSALEHYVLKGARAGFDPNALFSASYYLAKNPDVAASGLDPLDHYLKDGWREGRKPHPLFDPAWYLERHPDVAASGQEPLGHYISSGIAEGRQPSIYFDPEWYARTSGASSNLAAYVDGGWRSGASPHPLFDTAFYLASNPDVAAADMDPLAHYVADGWQQHRAPHPLFDVRWHLDNVPAARAANVEPLGRFLASGAAAGEPVSPYFDAHHYAWSRGKSFENPLLSYLREDAEGGEPHPLFDEAWYVSRHAKRIAPFERGLAHYVREGRALGLQPHLLFDTNYYKTTNPDVAADGSDPFLHYWTVGGREGRNPHPLFDGRLYLTRYTDIAAAGLNPLGHYLRSGAAEGRDPHPLFQASHYIEQKRNRSAAKAPLRTAAPAAANAATYVYTSAAFNYVHKARLLGESLGIHHPEVRRVLVLSERATPENRALAGGIVEFDEVLFIEDLGIPDFWSWAFRHTIVEMCTAVKGWVADALLARNGVEQVIYLDPDVVVLDRLQPVLEALEKSSIVVTPHQTHPAATLDEIKDNELSSLLVGVYNLGFLALKADADGRAFASWWRDRLLRFCYEESERGIYTDQRWVDFAPAYFDKVHVLRHPGCNFARWNLAERWVTGGTPNHLQVNGERAIFFHCSGSENGRRNLSEAKHAYAMPSMHALLDWYDAQTARLDGPGYSGRVWSMRDYASGVTIQKNERRVWRDTPALQGAVSDPYSREGQVLLTGSADGVTPAAERVDVKRMRVLTPLEDYLLAGSAADLEPNPYFSPAHYRRSNGDVVAAGIEALTHYADTGWREGRKTHPDFDAAYYQSTVAPSQRDGDPLRHYLEQGQMIGLRVNRKFDAVRDARAMGRIAANVGQERPVVLFMSHGQGGGVRAHIDTLADLISGEADTLLLQPGPDGLLALHAISPVLPIALHFDPKTQLGELAAQLRKLNVSRIHVHHWMSMLEAATELLDIMGVPYDVTLHDYFSLAPQPFLTGDFGRFVGEDLDARTYELIRNGEKSSSPRDLVEWRRWSGRILGGAERVISPSADLARRVGAYFPELRTLRVETHPEVRTQVRDGAVARKTLANNDVLRIAVIGNIAIHKGLPTFVRCVQLCQEWKLPLEFVCLGDLGIPAADVQGLGVEVTGTYKDGEAVERLRGLKPDVVWFPTRWPETYCFTLSHAIDTGLPIAAGALGAFIERLQGRPSSWLLRWDIGAEEWIAFFMRLRSQMMASAERGDELVTPAWKPPAAVLDAVQPAVDAGQYTAPAVVHDRVVDSGKQGAQSLRVAYSSADPEQGYMRRTAFYPAGYLANWAGKR